MKAQRFAPLIAVLCPLLIAAADDAPKGDLGKFQGKWKTMVGPEKNFAVSIVIQGNSVTVSGTIPNGEEFEVKGELKLNETAKPFKTVDWIKFAGPDGNDAPENKGIYEFVDADTIKLCNGGPGNDRPAEFKDGEGEGGGRDMILLKREKD